MAKARARDILRASVLDRLTGAHGAAGAPGSLGLRELKRAVVHDLEWLLNSRCWWPMDITALEEASTSLINYGIGDLSIYSWISSDDRRLICSMIEDAVRTFEPRLQPRSVKVSLVERNSVEDFSVRIRIEAVLHVEPYTEMVSFDTDIHFDTGEFEVKGEA